MLEPVTDPAAWRPKVVACLRSGLAATGDYLPAEIEQMVSAEVPDPLPADSQVCRVPGSGGWVWWGARPHGAVLGALDMPPEAVESAVAALPRPLSYRRLRGDALTSWVHDALCGELVSTNMTLEVSSSAASSGGVALRPMTAERYAEWSAGMIEHYAGSIFGTGRYPNRAAAQADAQRQTADLLPDGVATEGMLLWTAHEGEQEVGVLWIQQRPARGFIYDIEVNASLRGGGYGTQMLRLGAAEMAARGVNLLSLNVFGTNPRARALYEREGYAVIQEFFRA
ncbi:GNAT family N-acetyltransferase [Calidifontibacter sp. DB0510]|uniref:GNAT family N-acetyltransferase n=1 Tax=Metallococcus carri TaxID=1656884 RepID=A0A967B722_9MICO|nr:GNAT family N-acetyltransferase [Metallococcus carri]NHN56757.1 GNAT family N-acetyltransferase [Metallococcus carri]NOP37866.1 GNAT family N-acetyltransferase [Calidifontibacter sp. DB2511S]